MKLHAVIQGSPEWRALRQGIPTATDFKEIVTAVKGDLSTASSGLINKLIDQRVRPEAQDVFTGNKHTERGLELEPKARNWYRFLTSSRVYEGGFVTRDDGRAGCSPDGLVLLPDGTPIMGLEIKCPDGPTHVGYLRARELPPEYKQQVHGSMAISGLKYWDFVSYCPGYEPLIVNVRWDAYTDKCAAALEKFLADLDAAIEEVCPADV